MVIFHGSFIYYFCDVLIEGCSSVRMDEGGIEPFKTRRIQVRLFICIILVRMDEGGTRAIENKADSGPPFYLHNLGKDG